MCVYVENIIYFAILYIANIQYMVGYYHLGKEVYREMVS